LKNKRIAIVLPDLGGGGAEKVALAVANGLSKENDVRLILFKREGIFLEYLSKDVELVVLNKDHKNIKQIFSLIRLLRKNLKDRDLFIAGFQLFTEFYSLIATFNMKIKKISVSQIDIRQIISIKGYPMMPFKIIGSILYRFFDICICSSKGVKRSLRKVFNVKKKKLRVIYNPVFDVENNNSGIDIDYERPIFITLARLNYQKRLDIMIKAFAKYLKKNKNGTLLILGEGDLEEELKKLSLDLNVLKNLKFLGFKKNVSVYLNRADVFLLTSDFEGFGNVIVEAMANALPVISTDCPSGPSEILKKGKYGKLTPVGDVDSFSDAMEDLIRDEKELKKYSELSLERAKEFSLEKIIGKYKDVIKRL